MRRLLYGTMAGVAAVGGVLYGGHEALTSPTSIDPNNEAGRHTLMREAAEAYRDGEYDNLFPSLIIPFVHEYYLNNYSQLEAINISIETPNGYWEITPSVGEAGEVEWSDTQNTNALSLSTKDLMEIVDKHFVEFPYFSMSVSTINLFYPETDLNDVIPIYGLAHIPIPEMGNRTSVGTKIEESINFSDGILTPSINITINSPINSLDITFTDSIPMQGTNFGLTCYPGQIRYLPCDSNLSQQVRKLPPKNLISGSLFVALQSFGTRE